MVVNVIVWIIGKAFMIIAQWQLIENFYHKILELISYFLLIFNSIWSHFCNANTYPRSSSEPIMINSEKWTYVKWITRRLLRSMVQGWKRSNNKVYLYIVFVFCWNISCFYVQFTIQWIRLCVEIKWKIVIWYIFRSASGKSEIYIMLLLTESYIRWSSWNSIK